MPGTMVTKIRYMASLYPNSKVHGANMGPISGRQDPGGPHVGPMNFGIWVGLPSELSCYWYLGQHVKHGEQKYISKMIAALQDRRHVFPKYIRPFCKVPHNTIHDSSRWKQRLDSVTQLCFHRFMPDILLEGLKSPTQHAIYRLFKA